MLKNLSRWIGPDPAEGLDEEIQPEELTFDMSQSENPVLRLLAKPRLVAGIAASFCVMATVTYIVAGLYWMAPQAAPAKDEPIAMMGIDEAATAEQAASVEQVSKKTPLDGLAAVGDEILAMAGIAEPGTEDKQNEKPLGPSGRPDPFAPLVVPPIEGGAASGPMIPGEDEGPRDPMEFLQYTGYIGELTSKDKVAIIRISDELQGEYTVIKKAGETFLVNGELVTLASIGPDALHLKIAGASRRLDLNPYVEIAGGGSGGGLTGGGFSGGRAGSRGGAGGSGGGASGSAGGGDPTNPTLAEPSAH